MTPPSTIAKFKIIGLKTNHIPAVEGTAATEDTPAKEGTPEIFEGYVSLAAVTSGSPENDRFFAQGANALITLQIVSREAMAVYEQTGIEGEMWVSFTPAPKTAT